MMKPKITIAVTGINNIDSPGSGIPVIRGLRESTAFDARIIGLSYETLEPGVYMHDLVDKSYQIPMPSAGTQTLMDRLHYVHENEGIDVIIPNFDSELHNFIKIADVLESEYNIVCFLPSQEQFESRHKSVLFEFGKQHNVKVPFSKMIFSTAEIYEVEKEISYPMVIKGKYYDASIAATREQAIAHFHKISGQWGLPIIVQEFVAGNEVNVTALGDGKGSCIGAIPMRKLYITDKGKAWAGIALDDPELVKISRRVVENSHWKGGCELEFIKTKGSDYYLIEMNPRFPAWIYLAVGCGQNHLEALVQMALGETVEPFADYDVGKLFIRYSFDLITTLEEFEKISTSGEL